MKKENYKSKEMEYDELFHGCGSVSETEGDMRKETGDRRQETGGNREEEIGETEETAEQICSQAVRKI